MDVVTSVWARVFVFLAVVWLIPSPPATAQEFVPCPPPGAPLLEIPEIDRDPLTRTLKAVITVGDEQRRLWFRQGGSEFCASQRVRHLTGQSQAYADQTWPEEDGLALPLPGPTLRARVGDVVQLTLLNQIDASWYALSYDRGEQGLGCDRTTDGETEVYPGATGDMMPNCFHGSSTTNLHFHGIHTSPSTTGDNVLLQIRPSPRDANGQPVVTESSVREDFTTFFQQCASELRQYAGTVVTWPTVWEQLPSAYRVLQERLLREYDATAQYQGTASGLPPERQLWPRNRQSIEERRWPNYYVGAFPNCFELPEYLPAEWPPVANRLQMGQAPGTHWYHAHKHGSTHLNVANGMTGAFVVAGAYDDDLREFYRSTGDHRDWDLVEKVMVIQQLGLEPNLMRVGGGGRPALSVNGRRQPVVTMRPGEVQLWRIVNTAPISGVAFEAPTDGLEWRQTAQDGVQLAPANYAADANRSAPFLLASANRADLLVRAPLEPGLEVDVQVTDTVSRVPGSTPTTLLTVRVASDPAGDPTPAMSFPSEAEFPPMPPFLRDIEEDEVDGPRRELVFDTEPQGNHTIDGEKFGEDIDQAIVLNKVEEWKIANATVSPRIAHPFHIHVNPFQVVEVFEPLDPRYQVTDPQEPCYLDPDDETTWQPCPSARLSAPYVWWDTFAIPAAREASRADGTTVTIPGYFTMRSRFTDYTGQFVLHCHILAHEDRGMMQMVAVVSNRPAGDHR